MALISITTPLDYEIGKRRLKKIYHLKSYGQKSKGAGGGEKETCERDADYQEEFEKIPEHRET